jgi:hypothetical protein
MMLPPPLSAAASDSESSRGGGTRGLPLTRPADTATQADSQATSTANLRLPGPTARHGHCVLNLLSTPSPGPRALAARPSDPPWHWQH